MHTFTCVSWKHEATIKIYLKVNCHLTKQGDKICKHWRRLNNCFTGKTISDVPAWELVHWNKWIIFLFYFNHTPISFLWLIQVNWRRSIPDPWKLHMSSSLHHNTLTLTVVPVQMPEWDFPQSFNLFACFFIKIFLKSRINCAHFNSGISAPSSPIFCMMAQLCDDNVRSSLQTEVKVKN